jgi:hypothetical protein
MEDMEGDYSGDGDDYAVEKFRVEEQPSKPKSKNSENTPRKGPLTVIKRGLANTGF